MSKKQKHHQEPSIHWDNKLSVWETDSVVYWIENGVDIWVPVGFQTDLATVPPPFSLLFKTFGKHNRAAIVHDYLFKKRGKIKGHTFTRPEIDRIFLNIMKADGVSSFFRNTMYLFVRLYTLIKSW